MYGNLIKAASTAVPLLLLAGGAWVWRNRASRLVWREGSSAVRVRNTIRMSGYVAFQDDDLDVQLDYEWWDSVYYIEAPALIFSSKEPAHDLSSAERAMVLLRVERAFQKFELRCSFAGLPGLTTR
ncbi:hypothetical protein [Terriglobus sp.]|uniref:hypothetical protein n=1 Tax=Terriglobus sp. TaxID=1889013 RepID=UPI003AFF6E6A